MQETKLISLRVPADLLEKIDAAATESKALTRSGIIVNYLNAVFDAADSYTRFVMSTWPMRKKQPYKFVFQFDPKTPDTNTLNSTNLITP